VRVIRLGWLGTRTPEDTATVEFFTNVLGLETLHREPGFTKLRLPSANRDYLEIFGSEADASGFEATHYTTGPVVGVVVEDLAGARAELAAAGVELVGEVTWPRSMPGYGWFHFRAPDGNLYAMIQDSQPTDDPAKTPV